MHLPLTFSGWVCILSLQGRQKHCPFTTRLRGLKLTRDFSLVILFAGLAELAQAPGHSDFYRALTAPPHSL